MSSLSQDHAPATDAVTSGQSEMVERVARAVEGVDLTIPGDPPMTIRVHGDGAIRLARAAIEAMREPILVMIEAATESSQTGHPSDGWYEGDLPTAWRAMIDAALQSAPPIVSTNP